MSQKVSDYDASGHVKRFHNSYSVDSETGCWNWQQNLHQGGYGRIYVEGSNVRAHRYSYEHHYGPYERHFSVLHKCDNPACVNPEHLYLGTQSANMFDKKERGRSKGINLGELNANCKISDKDVSEIFDLLKSKLFSQKCIGKFYGVDQSHISRIQNNIKRQTI